MLTPQEISDKVFVRAVFNGYDMSGVDDFLETVSADYAALYKENAILKGKIKVLVEKVEEYRSTEDSMRMALLTAQRMGEDIVADANKKSAEMLVRTDAEIRDKLVEMGDRLADEEARLNAAAKETMRFVEISQEIMRRHGEFLSKLDRIRHAAEPAPPPKPEPTREEKIADAASQIGTAVEKLTGSEAEPVQQMSDEPEENSVRRPVVAAAEEPLFNTEPTEKPVAAVQQAAPEPAETEGTGGSVFDDESEPTKLYVIKNGGDDDGASPKPRFDFENLKFGSNFSHEE